MPWVLLENPDNFNSVYGFAVNFKGSDHSPKVLSSYCIYLNNSLNKNPTGFQSVECSVPLVKLKWFVKA